jgi:hypothetical protein
MVSSFLMRNFVTNLLRFGQIMHAKLALYGLLRAVPRRAAPCRTVPH